MKCARLHANDIMSKRPYSKNILSIKAIHWHIRGILSAASFLNSKCHHLWKKKKNHFLERYSYASILKNESHRLSWFPKVRSTFLCSSFSLVASVCFPRFSTRFRNHLPASSAFSCWPKYVRASLNDNCVFVFESSLSVLCCPCWDYKE